MTELEPGTLVSESTTRPTVPQPLPVSSLFVDLGS